ncbi:hypothetical protein [Nonomuraea sp. NPDC049695]|uniref:hypothetical protein n=1 Tax=Nonomuraea sp. NPDC049695 TaxID=3154734 RepID=UPI003412528F
MWAAWRLSAFVLGMPMGALLRRTLSATAVTLAMWFFDLEGEGCRRGLTRESS